MRTDFRFRRNHCFYLSFFSKIEPTILSSGRLILIKRLITTSGTDFSLETACSYAWQPLLCLVETSCMQNVIKLNFWLVKTISSHFFRY